MELALPWTPPWELTALPSPPAGVKGTAERGRKS